MSADDRAEILAQLERISEQISRILAHLEQITRESK